MMKRFRLSKQMLLYSLSNLIAGFGSQTYAFAISFYILETTGSAFSFALQLLFNVLPRTMAGPFIGVLVDRYSKRKLIIYSQIASLLIVLSLATYMYLFGVKIVAIYVTTALLSVTASFTSITFSAAITELFETKEIQRATSLNQIAISSAAILSPIIGGIMYGFLPLYGILFLFVSLFLLAVLFNSQLSFIRKQFAEKESGNEPDSMFDNIKKGFVYTKNHQFAMRILIVALIINFVFAAYEIGFSYSLIHNFKITASLFGITESGFAFGMLGVSVLLATIPTVRRPMHWSKLLLFCLGFVMISSVIPYFIPLSLTYLVIYYFIVMFLIGISIASSNTIIITVLQKSIDDRMKGRFFGLLETFAMAISPVSFILFGFLFDVFRADLLLIIISVAFIVAIIILIPRHLLLRIDEIAANDFEENEIEKSAMQER